MVETATGSDRIAEAVSFEMPKLEYAAICRGYTVLVSYQDERGTENAERYERVNNYRALNDTMEYNYIQNYYTFSIRYIDWHSQGRSSVSFQK